MSWDDLRAYLNDLKQRCDDRLDDTVTVYCVERGEFFPADTIEFEEGDDILPKGSLFIVIQD